MQDFIPSPSRGGLGWGWGVVMLLREIQPHPHPNLPPEGEGVKLSPPFSFCEFIGFGVDEGFLKTPPREDARQ
jgi:hypothetical protein